MSPGRLSGLGVSPGIAVGEPVVQETRPITVLRIPLPASRIEHEVKRFHQAVEATIERIMENRDQAARQMGEDDGSRLHPGFNAVNYLYGHHKG